MKRTLALAAVAVSLLVAAPARADIQTSGPETYPGKFAVDAHLGFSAGVLGGTPGGFKFQGGFGYKLSDLLWIDAGVNFVFGGSGNVCFNHGGYYDCGLFGDGIAIEPYAGIKLKFKINQVPIVPYAKADAVFMGIVNRFCGDNGFGVGGRVAGGAHYFLTKNIGLGIEISTLLGPAFYNGYGGCFAPGSHAEVYWSIDFGIVAEFAF